MSRLPFRRAGAAVALATIAACSHESNPEGPWFADRSADCGVDFTNVCGGPEKKYILDSMGAGVALLDMDGDGDLDLFFVQGATRDTFDTTAAPSDRLFKNEGGFRFTDVTDASGVRDTAWGNGVSAGDVDDDGDEDLFITNWGSNVLRKNDGSGRFTDATKDAGLESHLWSSSSGFADYDQDGDLDLFVATYLEFDWARPPEGVHNWKGVPSYIGPMGLTPEPDYLYRNEGGGRFVDVSEEMGIRTVDPAYGLGSRWFDADDDGDQDLYVANDTTPNHLFVNEVKAHGKFVENAITVGLAYNADGAAQAGMGVNIGDADGDARLDVFVTNFSFDYNTLYKNQGDGMWDASAARGDLRQDGFTPMGWGTALFDAELDGDLDVSVANGHLYPLVDQSRLAEVVTYRELNHLFANDGKGAFTNVTKSAGPGFALVQCTRGVATGDLDGDGDVDLVFTNIDDRPAILENKSAHGHWLTVRLKQAGKNRDAIGARVLLTAGGRTQVRDVQGGGSYLCHSDLALHFGLGADTNADLSIRWPDGIEEKRAQVGCDRVLVIERGAP